MERDGNIRGSRFCAGCHDPVPFFSGEFNDPNFDDVKNPTAHAGITCSVCHSIVNVNSIASATTHLNGEYVLTLEGGARLKVSRSYRERIRSLLGG